MSMQARLPSEKAWLARLYLPSYTVSDAARYAGTHRQTVAYWHYYGGSVGPVLPGKERKKPLSYYQLVEVAFVATFRAFQVPLKNLRAAHSYFSQAFNVEYPFAQLRLKTEGFHVLKDYLEVVDDGQLRKLIAGDKYGQLGWEEMVSNRFAEFEYNDEHGIAITWHVAGRQSPVVIDPRISFGAPTVKGIPTWALKGRYIAGEEIQDISADFVLEADQVAAALRFEGVEIKQAA